MTHTELGIAKVSAARYEHIRPGPRTRDPLICRDASAIVLGLSKDPHPKTTMLLFRPGAAVPWAAAKLASTDTARRAVSRESSFLTELHRTFTDPILRTVPRRLGAFEADLPAGSMLVEALGGTPLSVIYARRNHLHRSERVQHDLAAVSAWLHNLQSATTQGHGAVAFGEPVLADLHARFASDPRTERVLRALATGAATLAGHQGPKTVVHGDFWLGNVLVDDNGVSGVVDWENAQLIGEPLRDVARFALTYALYIDRRTSPGRRIRGHNVKAGPWGVGVTYVMTGGGWFPGLIRDFTRDAMSRLGVNPMCWRDLLLLGLADVAAGADDDEFAHRHLVLLDELIRTVQ